MIKSRKGSKLVSVAKNLTDKSLANLKPFPPGVSGNPGGVPKGKRIDTWIAEFGQIDPQEWPTENSEEENALPAFARIALARLRDALGRDKLALANSEYVEPNKSNQEQPGVTLSKDTFLELCQTYWETKPK